MQDIGAVIDALTLVSKFAAIEHSDENRDVPGDTNDIRNIQRRLDELQSRQELKGTSLPSLVKSIHRLKSNIGHLQVESEQNSNEIKRLNQTLDDSMVRITQLEAAVRELYRENTEIRRKYRLKKKECRNFAKNVKEYVTIKRKEEMEKDDRYAAACISIHETILKLNQSKNRGEDEIEIYDGDTDHHTIASSLDDFDSQRKFDPIDLSIIDTSLEDASWRSFDLTRTSSTDSPIHLKRHFSSSSQAVAYGDPRGRTTSLDSLASTQSRVTDTCVPTVRFDSHTDSEFQENSNSSSQNLTYFVNDTSKIGLVLKIVEIPLPRKPLIDSSQLDSVDSSNAVTAETAVKSMNAKIGIVSKIDDLFSRNQDKKKERSMIDESDCAIVVSGYDDVYGTASEKPSVGSRLIAIGEESLINKKQLSLEMIYGMIDKASADGDVHHRTVKLTFRDAPLMHDKKRNQVDTAVASSCVKGDSIAQKMDEKPKFFEKIFPRDQRKEKDPSSADKPHFPHLSGNSLLKRDFFARST